MIILSDNPVFVREVRWWLRLRRLRKNKAVFWPLVAVFGCIGWFYLAGLLAFTGTTGDARNLWFWCMFVQLFLISVLSPLLAASAVSQERERQTWETLQATPLTGPQILGGKWLARQAPLAMMMLLLLPPVLVCGFVGDMAPTAVLYVFPVLLLTSLVFGIVGLACSFLFRRTVTAVTVSLLLAAVVCLGPVLLFGLIGFLGFDFQSEDHPALLAISPFYVLFDMLHGLNMEETPHFKVSVIGQYAAESAAVMIVCSVFLAKRYRKVLLT